MCGLVVCNKMSFTCHQTPADVIVCTVVNVSYVDAWLCQQLTMFICMSMIWLS